MGKIVSPELLRKSPNLRQEAGAGQRKKNRHHRHDDVRFFFVFFLVRGRPMDGRMNERKNECTRTDCMVL
jgi:hypothetical protein